MRDNAPIIWSHQGTSELGPWTHPSESIDIFLIGEGGDPQPEEAISGQTHDAWARDTK